MSHAILPDATEKLLQKMDGALWLKNFYLAGGTALALQYHHRESIDLDWFTQKPIQTPALIKHLSKLGKFTLVKEEENTVEGILDKVKLSFMTYPYPLIAREQSYLKHIKIASVHDIAIMKLEAIAGRNTKKDFIDLYLYLHREKKTLPEILAFLSKKFKGIDYDYYHLLKSLIYFVEADREPMPRMLEKVDWKIIKSYFQKETKKMI